MRLLTLTMNSVVLGSAFSLSDNFLSKTRTPCLVIFKVVILSPSVPVKASTQPAKTLFFCLCLLNCFITTKKFVKCILGMRTKMLCAELNLFTGISEANGREHEFVFSAFNQTGIVLLMRLCEFIAIIINAFLPDECAALSHGNAMIEMFNTCTGHKARTNSVRCFGIKLCAIVCVSICINAKCLKDLSEREFSHE